MQALPTAQTRGTRTRMGKVTTKAKPTGASAGRNTAGELGGQRWRRRAAPGSGPGTGRQAQEEEKTPQPEETASGRAHRSPHPTQDQAQRMLRRRPYFEGEMMDAGSDRTHAEQRQPQHSHSKSGGKAAGRHLYSNISILFPRHFRERGALGRHVTRGGRRAAEAGRRRARRGGAPGGSGRSPRARRSGGSGCARSAG